MVDMKLIKCPYCGAKDGITSSHNIYKCSYCDSEFYVCDNETRITLEEAYNDLIRYKFEDADDLYRKLSRDALDNNNLELYAMAEWGRLLAYFGVVYIRDFEGSVSIPTFTKYDSRVKSVKKSNHYNNIMDSDASSDIKKRYEKMASKLDETYSRIGSELKKTPEYDVFLCVKISLTTEKDPDLEGYTKDSMIAYNIYEELTKRGLKVFYSEKCCQGIEYDSQILSALSRSKMLLVVSTKNEYLESAWVQSEWRRWLNFIDYEEKKKNSLILFIPNYDQGVEIPRALTHKKVQHFDDSLKVVNAISETIDTYKRGEKVTKPSSVIKESPNKKEIPSHREIKIISDDPNKKEPPINNDGKKEPPLKAKPSKKNPSNQSFGKTLLNIFKSKMIFGITDTIIFVISLLLMLLSNNVALYFVGLGLYIIMLIANFVLSCLLDGNEIYDLYDSLEVFISFIALIVFEIYINIFGFNDNLYILSGIINIIFIILYGVKMFIIDDLVMDNEILGKFCYFEILILMVGLFTNLIAFLIPLFSVSASLAIFILLVYLIVAFIIGNIFTSYAVDEYDVFNDSLDEDALLITLYIVTIIASIFLLVAGITYFHWIWYIYIIQIVATIIILVIENFIIDEFYY